MNSKSLRKKEVGREDRAPKGLRDRMCFPKAPVSFTRQKHVFEGLRLGRGWGSHTGRISEQRTSVQALHLPDAKSR